LEAEDWTLMLALMAAVLAAIASGAAAINGL
jgi:hypothetical protein